ncbi:DNA gyrase inhibitor YacG [Caulobacter sp. D5]|uniref:DNA gyrase inhibitor YacG n=1 Tax=Caulobacter sp. D5 TaxID=357400 RepID=UPI000D73AEDF|nr:DNA gyrase inhibitor YacG [Caulobacter sp. D5]PXA89355.1 DNA gyrase inhibitor YacG [Caulobacter sp. D5]
MSSPCPICRKPATPEARPFCSKRCADVDLQRWLSDRYVVPGAQDDEENPLSTDFDN